MRHASYIILGLAASLAVVSCVKENFMDPAQSGDAIKMTSYRQQVFTRADIDDFDFAAGTKYTLFAVQSKENAADYKWITEKGFVDAQPKEGVEKVTSGIHEISYAPVSLFTVGETLDFYGLVYNDPAADAPAIDGTVADNVTPTATIGEDQDRLDDLMHSNTAKKRTSADGIVTMPFEHALAAVNFVIAKQDESNDQEQDIQLTGVKVTEIRLDNVAEEASINVVDGKWNWVAGKVGSRVVYSGEAKAIDTMIQPIGDEDVLIFPNDDYVDSNNKYDASQPYKYYNAANDESASKGEQIIVSVKLEGLVQYDAHDGYIPMNKTLKNGDVIEQGAGELHFPVRVYNETTGEDDGPLHFLRNHKYTLSIFVMRDNVRIVAVSPQVYEWVDVTLDPVADPTHVATLGQPITIGTTVWMDRNIGATSADCQHDWWHTVGYYYEYARNIPFILDVDLASENYYVPDKYYNTRKSGNPEEANDQHFLCYKKGPKKNQPVLGNPNVDRAYSDYLVYTYDQNGNKVSKFDTKMLFQYAGYIRNGSAEHNGQYVAINPGDKGSYAYIATNQNDVGRNGGQESWCDFVENTHIRNYWYTVDNQPAPKGWRLPTAKDVYTIMPENSFHWFYNGNRFRQVGVAETRHTTGPALESAGDYVYQYFYGNFEVDKSAPKTQAWSKPKYKGSGPSDPYQTRIYGIKHQGTSKAYRYMIETHNSDEHNLGYARVYIYPASAQDKFKSDKAGHDAIGDDEANNNLYSSNPQWNLHQFDWDHPSTYIDFPFTGCFNGHYKPYNDNKPHMYLNLFGRDMKYRLMETNNMTDNYCMKLSNDGLGFAGTWHSTTGTVRLVRDLEIQ